MSNRIDSYVSNWIRVDDLGKLRALIDQLSSYSEPCESGENWHIEEGLGDSVRIIARDLFEGDLTFRDESDTLIQVEASIKQLLAPEEVLVWTSMSWIDGSPQFSCRVYFEDAHYEINQTDMIEAARVKLGFPASKVNM